MTFREMLHDPKIKYWLEGERAWTGKTLLLMANAQDYLDQETVMIERKLFFVPTTGRAYYGLSPWQPAKG